MGGRKKTTAPLPDVNSLFKQVIVEKVEVGRVYPAMPEFMRVTIGTRPQMDAFVSAFREVMS